MSFKKQNQIAEKYEKDFINYLNTNQVLKALEASEIKIEKSTVDEDLQYVADLVCTKRTTNLRAEISLRVLCDIKDFNYQTITIRSTTQLSQNGYQPSSGKIIGEHKVEYQKILEGRGKFNATCFVNKNKKIMKYLLVDFNILRMSGLLDHEQIKKGEDVYWRKNGDDHNGFIAIKFQALRDFHCIINEYDTIYNLPEFWRD